MNSSDVERLSELVTEHASGVFLWVKLVLQSVLEGFESCDRYEDMLNRIELLPKDLEDLYNHMLNRLSIVHYERAMITFGIMLQHQQSREQTVLSLVDLKWALDLPVHDANTASQPAKDSDSAFQPLRDLSSLEKKLKATFCGLIETVEHKLYLFEHDFEGRQNGHSEGDKPGDRGQKRLKETAKSQGLKDFGFVHRTVADYLRQFTHWTREINAVKKFDTEFAIRIRNSLIHQSRSRNSEPSAKCLAFSRALYWTFRVPEGRPSDPAVLSADLESIWIDCWRDQHAQLPISLEGWLRYGLDGYVRLSYDDFIALATAEASFKYLEVRLHDDPSLLLEYDVRSVPGLEQSGTNLRRRPLSFELLQALLYREHIGSDDGYDADHFDAIIKTIEVLLDTGLNINERNQHGEYAWDDMLRQLNRPGFFKNDQQICEVLQYIWAHGGDVAHVIRESLVLYHEADADLRCLLLRPARAREIILKAQKHRSDCLECPIASTSEGRCNLLFQYNAAGALRVLK